MGDQYLAAILASLVELTGEVRAIRQALEPQALVAAEVSERLKPVREVPVAAVQTEPEGGKPGGELPAAPVPARRGRRPKRGR